jgi:hypothetical protein
MPKTKISEFSATPANNTDIDSINIAEGCAPSGINDAIRELMAQLKDFQVGSAGDPVTVGGVLTVQAGSASTPSLTTAGDTNTGIFFPAADTIAFAEGGAEVARFDSSGNLGLGVTPSAVDSNYRSLQVGHATYVFSGNNQYTSFTEYSANAFFDTISTYKYKNTGFATKYRQNDGVHSWQTAPFGTAGNAITFTQAMTLTSDANLLIGTSDASMYDTNGGSNVGPTYYKAIFTGGGGSANYGFTASNGNSDAGIGMWGVNSASKRLRISAVISQYTSNTAGSEASLMSFHTQGSGVLTERARIDGSGNFLVNTTTSGGWTGVSKFESAANGTSYAVSAVQYNSNGHAYIARVDSTSSALMRFYYTASTLVGSITTNGTITAYNTTSDYRLKNVTGSLTGYKERLMSLQPKQGTWISNGSEFRGFLAHEFANPYRASVTGEKDAVDENGNPEMQSMQASSSEVMADLVALVQEQQAIIESLTTRITALEGQ